MRPLWMTPAWSKGVWLGLHGMRLVPCPAFPHAPGLAKVARKPAPKPRPSLQVVRP